MSAMQCGTSAPVQREGCCCCWHIAQAQRGRGGAQADGTAAAGHHCPAVARPGLLEGCPVCRGGAGGQAGLAQLQEPSQGAARHACCRPCLAALPGIMQGLSRWEERLPAKEVQSWLAVICACCMASRHAKQGLSEVHGHCCQHPALQTRQQYLVQVPDGPVLARDMKTCALLQLEPADDQQGASQASQIIAEPQAFYKLPSGDCQRSTPALQGCMLSVM